MEWRETRDNKTMFHSLFFLSPDNSCSVDISNGNDSWSDLNKSCEVANIEADWSSMHIECINEDKNCDGIVAELYLNHQSDDEERKNEDIRDNIELIDLKDMLPSITRHRALATEFGNIQH